METPVSGQIGSGNYLQKTVNYGTPFPEKSNTPFLRQNMHFAVTYKTLTDAFVRHISAWIDV
ncbi:MAG: hypothetical protein Q7J03_02820 [Methanoregula sp.]|nr:hypothetical protein [Methanoregula sp.]